MGDEDPTRPRRDTTRPAGLPLAPPNRETPSDHPIDRALLRESLGPFAIRLLLGTGGMARVDLGEPYFVLIQNQPREPLDPEQIHAAVLHLAERGDALEQRLAGRDRH